MHGRYLLQFGPSPSRESWALLSQVCWNAVRAKHNQLKQLPGKNAVEQDVNLMLRSTPLWREQTIPFKDPATIDVTKLKVLIVQSEGSWDWGSEAAAPKWNR